MIEFSDRLKRSLGEASDQSWTSTRAIVFAIVIAIIFAAIFLCPSSGSSDNSDNKQDWLFERLAKAMERQAVAQEKQVDVLSKILREMERCR